jgi:cyclopropane fatty-acyl-phospholipid synthase-like methyltransferase
MAMARVRAAVIGALDLQPGLCLLELGSGPGRLAIEIKQRHPSVDIDAVDADPAMVEQARRNAQAAGVAINVIEGDITKLPDLGRYDRIYSTLVFHHLKPDGKRRALMKVRELLSPQGCFVIADFGRPRGLAQWLVSHVVQPVDGIANTAPHRDGRFERVLREIFETAEPVAAWKTFAGTLQVWICRPRA